MSVTEFLSDPQRWGNHFNQKQRVNVVGVTICRESQERHEMMMMDGWMTMVNDHELDLSWICVGSMLDLSWIWADLSWI